MTWPAAFAQSLSFLNKQNPWLSAHDYQEKVINDCSGTRPTAVNLFWALKRMKRVFEEVKDHSADEIGERLLMEARAIHSHDIEVCKAIGENGARLIADNSTILTYCNAGALATGGEGTALGIIRASSRVKKIRVFACETRPYLQGARLTTWELMKDGIDTTLITDNMACHFISKGMIQAVIVGADRVAANGDAANKIGTLCLAVIAKHYGVPIYFAVPLSTIDPGISSGSEIPIEERGPDELISIGGTRISPEGVKVLNPAFDVTPAELISGIVTEKRVYQPPFNFSVRSEKSKK